MSVEQQLADAVVDLVGNYSQTRDEFAQLITGPADGGPAGDGQFPVTTPGGELVHVPSLPKVMDFAATRLSPDVENLTLDGAKRVRTAVTPGDMQAVMPAATSVLDLINAAMAVGIEYQVPVDLRWPIGAGLWLVDGTIVASKKNPANPNGEWLRPPEIIGGNCNIVYNGAQMLDCLFSMRNVSNARLSGLRFNGNDKVRGIDLSYSVQAAPSLGNSCRRLALENFVPTSVIPALDAFGANDCEFHDVLVAANNPADIYAIGMRVNAPGGAIRGSHLRINGGEFVFQAQCCTLLDCQAAGIRAIGNDDNKLLLLGGYYYASRSGVNIRIAAGKQIVDLTAYTRMENGYNDGRIIAGDNSAVNGSNTGYLNAMTFAGQLLAPDGANHNVKLFDASVGARNGPMVARVSGMTEYVDTSGTAAISVEANLYDRPHATRIGGGFQSRDADLDAIAALNGIGVLYYRSADGVWSAVTYGPNLLFADGKLTVPGLANYAPLAGATFSGAVNVPFIRAGDPAGPRAILEADGTTSYLTGYSNAAGNFNPLMLRASRISFGIGSGENVTLLPNGNFNVTGPVSTPQGFFSFNSSGTVRYAALFGGPNGTYLDAYGQLMIRVSDGAGGNLTEKVRVDSFGNVGIGTTAPAAKLHVVADGATASQTAATAKFGTVASTGRSINAGGTINASGADYAEYMTKADGCGPIAKGDVCGIDRDGKLTRTWADAISFMVKSTDPNLVGGDAWASHLGPRPIDPGQAPIAPVAPDEPDTDEHPEPVREAEEEPEAFAQRLAVHLVAARDRETLVVSYEEARAAFEEQAEAFPAELADYEDRRAAYEADLPVWEAELEAARATVDRIAYCGQTPVNVDAVTLDECETALADGAAMYLVAVARGGGIGVRAIREADMTLPQYIRRVGRVLRIQDARPVIDVQHG